ncbi:MAG: YceI family protein [Candidatus Limnocylindrales bacterium]
MTRPPAGSSGSPPLPRSGARWARRVLAAGGAAALLVAALGAWYLFLRPPGPPPVDLVALPGASAAGTTSPGALDGVWTLEPVSASGANSSSFVGYRVQEQLAGIGAHTAVGRTGGVTGSFTLRGTTVIAGAITADLATLKSNEPLRDAQLVHRGLQTALYPTATFLLTRPIDLGGLPAPGVLVRADATGRLTLHGQTRTVTIPLQARLAGRTVEVAGSLTIAFADYGIIPPTSFIALSVANHGILELRLVFAHT